jgi:hypothetical protein
MWELLGQAAWPFIIAAVALGVVDVVLGERSRRAGDALSKTVPPGEWLGSPERAAWKKSDTLVNRLAVVSAILGIAGVVGLLVAQLST